ncbi:MAG: hypothetical protein JXA06_06180 [Bacteroidetes bacterium]|nr:hypothetical protein [Bacteroidota bacterium]
MKIFYHLLLISLVAVGLSCKNNEVLTPTLNDDQILQLVYSSYKYPQGFYQEDVTNCSIYYENTISIMPLRQRGTKWYELCTEDHNQARAWSDSSNANGSTWRVVVSERETEKYFEFKRSDSSAWSLLSRVHKCSYLDRSMFDRLNPGSILGVFQKRPILASDVKILIEYLWFVDNYEIGGSKVLTSIVQDMESVYQILITETRVSYGDFGLHDNITVYESIYSVSKFDGTITLSKKVQRSIQGHMN